VGFYAVPHTEMNTSRSLAAVALGAALLGFGCSARPTSTGEFTTGTSPPTASPTSSVATGTFTAVHVTRDNGLLLAPSVDRTLMDAAVVRKLQGDIVALPPPPPVSAGCPGSTANAGVTYTLSFSGPHDAATAVLDADGCPTLYPVGGSALNAAQSPLGADLAAALGMTAVEFSPKPCGSPVGAACYPYRSMAAAPATPTTAPSPTAAATSVVSRPFTWPISA
jgi:hypothetical protein